MPRRVDRQHRRIDRPDRVRGACRGGRRGGPVVNGAGQVVGITTAASVNYKFGPGGEGCAIPINDAMAIAGQIRSREPIDSVHIGPPVLLASECGPRRNAAQVWSSPTSCEAGPQIRRGFDGDIITVTDGTSLDTANTLTYVLDRHYPGDVLDLTWMDVNGEARTGKAILTPT